MSTLSRDDILKLAQLARLQLSDAEVVEYTQELSQILQYVEQLSSVDVSELQPTNHVTGLVNVMREDVIKDYGYAPEALRANLPDQDNDHIKVRRMIG